MFDDEWDDDEENEEDDDGFGEEDDDGYGEDLDDEDDGFGDEEDQDEMEGEEDESEEVEEKEKEEALQKSEKSENDPKKERRKFESYAKAKEFPTILVPLPCPKCKKQSLFLDKMIWNGIRITKAIAQAAVGAVDVVDALQSVRFVCMNPKCKTYYPKCGSKYGINPSGGGLVEHKNIFHVSR